MFKTIHNVQTNEVTQILFTPQEILEMEKIQAEFEKQTKAAIESATLKEAARAALLAKLGITADEAALLLG